MATRVTERTAIPAHLAPAAQGGPGASDRQLNYLVDLLGKRMLPNQAYEELKRRTATQREANAARGDRAANVHDGISSKRASEFIDRLLARPLRSQEERQGQGGEEEWRVMNMPRAAGETDAWYMVPTAKEEDHRVGAVPRGSYALANTRGAQNDVAFYSVWISKRGDRWSVKRYSSDELVGLPRSQQYGVLERIAEDPVAAAERYGLLIGKCGICHRKLTNEESRKRGIGPICAEKHGW